MHNERRWLAVSAIDLSLFLSALDGTIIALALPLITQHFRLSDSLVSSTMTLGYAIPLMVLVLLSLRETWWAASTCSRPSWSPCRASAWKVSFVVWIEFPTAVSRSRRSGLLRRSDYHTGHSGGRSRRLTR